MKINRSILLTGAVALVLLPVKPARGQGCIVARSSEERGKHCMHVLMIVDEQNPLVGIWHSFPFNESQSMTENHTPHSTDCVSYEWGMLIVLKNE